MRAAGLVGAYRRRRRGLTVRDPRAAPAPDLVRREFRAAGPDRLWVADVKQIPTGEGCGAAGAAGYREPGRTPVAVCPGPWQRETRAVDLGRGQWESPLVAPGARPLRA